MGNLKQIAVSEQVKETLDKLKKEGQHTSFDSVIRELLNKRKMLNTILQNDVSPNSLVSSPHTQGVNSEKSM